jgi:hypothetical protein
MCISIFCRNVLSASNEQSLDDAIQMPPTKRLSARSLALKQQLNSSNDSVMNGKSGTTATTGDTSADVDHISIIGLCWQDSTAALKEV